MLFRSGPHAIAAAKRQIHNVAHAGITESVVADTATAIADIRATPEAQEGLSAFLEKRKPRWVEPAAAKKTKAKKRA